MRINVGDPRGRIFVSVVLEGITDEQYNLILVEFDRLYNSLTPAKSVSQAFLFSVITCPDANPADLWWHVIYRTYLDKYGSDQSWKRTAGFALEEIFVLFYRPLLLPYGILISCLGKGDAFMMMNEMGIAQKVGKSKLDIVLRGQCPSGIYRAFGGIHVKSSLAERIQDDVPASVAMMDAGYWSGFLTFDAKAFPPPHGDAVVRGELGHRSDPEGALKRNYFERDAQFDNCYSYNTRTIPSQGTTASGKRIYKLSFSDPKPDQLMTDIINAWDQKRERLCS